jgi:hypothetical protein
MSFYSEIKIVQPEGPAVQGTKVFVDGIEQTHCAGIELTMLPEGVAEMKLKYFCNVDYEGRGSVERIHVCPVCRQELERETLPGTASAVETTTVSDQWIRKQVVAAKDEDGKLHEL